VAFVSQPGCSMMAMDTVPTPTHIETYPSCDTAGGYTVLDVFAAVGATPIAVNGNSEANLAIAFGSAALLFASSAIYGVVHGHKCTAQRIAHRQWLVRHGMILGRACATHAECGAGFICSVNRCEKAGAWREVCLPGGAGTGTCFGALTCSAGRCLTAKEAATPPPPPPTPAPSEPPPPPSEEAPATNPPLDPT
jgi:hypothetical protein